jgi:hypothetical protein
LPVSHIFFRSLPPGQRGDPSAVAVWIMAHVPCTDAGYKATPPAIQSQVFDALMREGVPIAVASKAMRTIFGDPIPESLKTVPSRTEDQWGKAPDKTRSMVATIEWLEHRFTVANNSGDWGAMHDIVQALVELLYHKAGGQREEFERARREVQSRARNLGEVVLHLTREELRNLRAAPTPGDFPRLRINPRRAQQSQAARRRARR